MMPNLSRRLFLSLIGSAAVMPTVGQAAQNGPLIIPLDIADRGIRVAVTIGGETLPFGFDTGGDTNAMRDDVARRLGLADTGERTRSLIVDGKVQMARRVAARDVLIGGAVRQPRMLFLTGKVAADLPVEQAGTIAGMLTAYDCDLNFGEASGELRLWPTGRPDAMQGTLLPDSVLRREFPAAASKALFVTAQIDGRPYRLKVDSRAGVFAVLYPAATKRSGLWNAPRYAPINNNRLIRASRLDLGPVALKRPYVSLVDPGLTGLLPFDGVIGLPLIQLLDWSVDADTGEVRVKRNARKPGWAGYQLAGLWFDRQDDGTIKVAKIGPASPAALAGLAVGDRIVTTAKFADFIKSLDRPAGSLIGLIVERDGTQRDVNLTLADYL